MACTASLGMYDGHALSAANDGFWALIAARLAERGIDDVPAALDRARPLDEIWSDPRLLLAQSCGYPLMTRYRRRLRYVATPYYAAPGCLGASYRSRIVVRADDDAVRLFDLQGRRAAVNDWQSNSGMNLLRAAVAPLAGGGRFFSEILETGSHEASIEAIAGGRADVAAIDAVSFLHATNHAPALANKVRTIGWTAPTPGLPFVTSIETPRRIVHELRRALADVIGSGESRSHRETLLLVGVEDRSLRAYASVMALERRAVRLGYPRLA